MTISTSSIGVIGAGAWGTALAMCALKAGRSVTLWGRDHQALVDLVAKGENKRYLPGIRLNPVPHITRDLSQVMQADIILLVVPAQEVRNLAPLMALHAKPGQIIVNCAKGIERGSGLLMSEVLSEHLPDVRLAVLSGPTFSSEVARGLPTAVTVASDSLDTAQFLVNQLSSRSFRCYASNDMRGVELCGAVKNVLAIACGIVMGRGLGDNARAALITRGLAELRRLGLSMGAEPETLMGLSGLGDMVLTCSSTQSRNFSLGQSLGQGLTLSDIEAAGGKLAEGRFTASALLQRAESLGVELPISMAVNAILNDGANIDEKIAELLSRPLRAEGA